MKKIRGTVAYINLEGGFWAIKGDDGTDWLPLEFPDQLKSKGARVELSIREESDAVTTRMWGRAMRIISFHTLGVEH